MDTIGSILFVLASTAIGGAEVKAFSLLKGLTGAKITLLTHSSVAEYYAGLGIRVRTFDEQGCSEPLPVSPIKTLRYARAIAKTARQEESQCLIGIMHTGSFYVSAAKDIFRMKKPHIGTIEGNVTAYFNIEKRSPTFIEKTLLWYLLRRPSMIAVPSGGVKSDLIKNFGLSGEKISIIHNGIDIDRVRAMSGGHPDIPCDYDGKTIMTSCRLNAQKDFVTLLKAFSEVRENMEARLIIIGGGELRDEIISTARDLEIDKDVTITGFQKNPFALMKAADVFVLSSFYEGFGNVIVEAMALGLPVVATDCPSGPSEIIQHGVSGLLVPPEDHIKMSEAMIQILTDERKRKELSSRGLERADSFRLETMIEEFTNLISRVSQGSTPAWRNSGK
jgi:glycosyltransferase involved in cell wall biosynthesis